MGLRKKSAASRNRKRRPEKKLARPNWLTFTVKVDIECAEPEPERAKPSGKTERGG